MRGPPAGFWPKIDREAVDDLFAPGFIATGLNAMLGGPNGVGKTMILKNVAHQAVVRGHTVRFSTASDMLADLAAQDSSAALARRLHCYTVPALPCIDEVGHLTTPPCSPPPKATAASRRRSTS